MPSTPRVSPCSFYRPYALARAAGRFFGIDLRRLRPVVVAAVKRWLEAPEVETLYIVLGNQW